MLLPALSMALRQSSPSLYLMPSFVVYSSRLSIELHLRLTFLESNGIECRIDGEALLSARPELPGYATLSVIDPNKVESAVKLLEKFKVQDGDATVQNWSCPSCSEIIEGQFTDCWKCGFKKTS